MSRFINWVLTVIAVGAGAALIADGIDPEDLFNDDASLLLCIATAVPAVVVAIRWHCDCSNAAADARLAEYETRMRQTYAELRAFITDAFAQHATRMEAIVADHAARMETSVNTHAERTGKNTVATAMGTVARMVEEAKMDRADQVAETLRWTDTGPFRPVR